MRLLFAFLLMPLQLFILLLLSGLILLRFKKRKWAKVFIITSLVWLFITSTSLLSRYPIQLLESQTVVLMNVPDSISALETHIMVLGGGHSDDIRFPGVDQLNNNSLGRLSEGIRLFRTMPQSKIIVSGWGAGSMISQAEVMAKAAMELGVPDTCLAMLKEPWNTKDEANEYLKNFGSDHPLIIVTDALHMPRALYHFRNAGLNPIPAPTNHIIKKGSKRSYIGLIVPSGSNIQNLGRAFHEYAGLLWAMMGGD
ncbi:MAG: ElyC/SanA/YdcF family protein [Salinivirgaceae bacterium]|nr:ElyC/SanA/YdcF family protein [Salinivirgaceae bacterium]